MKNVIIYKSNTGFTKEYAEMLSRRVVPSEVYSINKFKLKNVKDADNIFFGGPLKNNVIQGLNKFLKKYDKFKDKNIFIFAVGIEPFSEEKKENVIFANGLDLYHVRLYFLQGGMDINRMSPLKRKIFKLGMKQASKQQGISEEMINDRFSNGINFVNSSNLDKMIDVYHRINVNKK